MTTVAAQRLEQGVKCHTCRRHDWFWVKGRRFWGKDGKPRVAMTHACGAQQSLTAKKLERLENIYESLGGSFDPAGPKVFDG